MICDNRSNFFWSAVRDRQSLELSSCYFRSFLHKWGMASSAACDCGTEEQTVDHVVLQCPIHRPPHELHGLTVLDDETIEWLLNTCPEIQCGQAVVWRSDSNDEEEESFERLLLHAFCSWRCMSKKIISWVNKTDVNVYLQLDIS